MKNPKAMYALSYGLFVLTAQEGSKDNGCIINTAAQVTTTPNRLTIAVNKANFTHDMILRDGRFNLSILSERAPFSLFQHFGFSSGRETDKFAGFKDAARGENGLFYITEGTNAYLSCHTVSTMDLGSHTLFLADVLDGDVLSTDPSATYAYYQSHIKPKPQEKPAESGERWICTVCGYVHEGPLPEDFICPLCKHPASDFERM